MENKARMLKYVEIYTELRQAIEEGKYLCGSFLPSENELCAMYGASRTSVRRAIAMLEEDELTESRQGRGTKVLRGSGDVQLANRQVYQKVDGITSEYLREGEVIAMNSVVEMIEAERDVAGILNISEGTPVYRVRRLKVLEHTAFSYVVSYVPCRLAPGFEKFNGKVFALYKCLQEEYGIVSTSVVEKIACDTAKFLESNLLGVPVGSPVLLTKRRSMCGTDVMEYTESWIRPDIYQISVSMEGGTNYAENGK